MYDVQTSERGTQADNVRTESGSPFDRQSEGGGARDLPPRKFSDGNRGSGGGGGGGGGGRRPSRDGWGGGKTDDGRD